MPFFMYPYAHAHQPTAILTPSGGLTLSMEPVEPQDTMKQTIFIEVPALKREGYHLKHPVPPITLDALEAWISPSGDMYKNPDFAMHSHQAWIICALKGIEVPKERYAYEVLANRGWCHFRSHYGEAPEFDTYVPGSNGTREDNRYLTPQQKNTIFDWCLHHDSPFPKDVFGEENLQAMADAVREML